jgi:hypothetical protein
MMMTQSAGFQPLIPDGNGRDRTVPRRQSLTDRNGSRYAPDMAEENPWGKIVGPCYTTASLARELGVEPSAVSRAASDLRALRLVTSDDLEAFPAWQVKGGALVSGLAEVLAELRDGFDSPWMWAQWLAATPPGGTRSHIEDLRSGDVERAVLAARHAAAVWKQ